MRMTETTDLPEPLESFVLLQGGMHRPLKPNAVSSVRQQRTEIATRDFDLKP